MRYKIQYYFLFCLITLGLNSSLTAATYYSRITGNWNAPATWSTAGCGGVQAAAFPTAADNVIICNGNTVTVNVLSRCLNLTINTGGILSLPNAVNFTVNGTTSISGTLNDTRRGGVSTFIGLITVNLGGVWNSTTETTSTNMIFRGGLSNDGTFNAGAATFNTNSQSISGNSAMTFSSAITISGAIIVTNSNANLTINGALNGSVVGSTFTNQGTLNYGANAALMATGTVDATTTAGNTINYSRGGAQTIKTVNYSNLTISVSGTKTIAGAIYVAGNLTISAGVFALGTNILTVWGNITNAGSFTTTAPGKVLLTNGSSSHTITGTGTYTYLELNDALGATFSNITTINNNLTITAGTLTINANISVFGNILNNGSTAGTGRLILSGGAAAHTLTGTGTYNSLELNDALGAAMQPASSFSVTTSLMLTAGVFTINTNVLTINGALTYTTGTITGGANSEMVIAGSTAGITLRAVTGNLKNLTINNANNITLGAALTVSNTLTLTSGCLILGNFNLTISNSSPAAVSGTFNSACMIITSGTGVLSRAIATGANTYVFPIGENTGTVDYSPVSIGFTANSITRNIGIRVVDQTDPNNGAPADYISRYWVFAADAAGGTYTYNPISFSYAAADIIGTESNIKIYRWGTSWAELTSTAASNTMSTTTAFTQTTPLSSCDITGRVAGGGTQYVWNNTTTSWATSTNWTPTRTTPSTLDILVFNNGGTYTVTNVPTQTIGELNVSNNTNVTLTSAIARTLTISGSTADDLEILNGSTLQIGTNLTVGFNISTTVAVIGTLVVPAGTINFTNTIANVDGTITKSGGTITSSAANLTFDASSYYNHAVNGGTIPTATWNATSNCNITGITNTNLTGGFNQTFGNLIWNNTQTATGVTNGNVSIMGDLTITNGTIGMAGNNFSVLGITSISGTLNDATLAGTNSFSDFIINTGGIFNNSANSAVTISGDISRIGTFTPGTGLYTLSGAGKSISGTITIANLAVTGDYTNNNTLTISTALSGTGSLTNASGSILYLSGSATISNLLANTPTNTVFFNSTTGAQTIPAFSYYNLTVNKTGQIATLGGDVNIDGDLTITAGTLNTGGFNANVAGNVVNGGTHSGTGAIVLTNSSGPAHDISGTGAYSGLTLSDPSATLSTSSTFADLYIQTGTLSVGNNIGLTVTGTATIDDVLSISGNNGTRSFNNILIGTSGNFAFNGNSNVTISGDINNAGIFDPGTGSEIFTFSGTAKNINGSVGLFYGSNFPRITISGTITYNITDENSTFLNLTINIAPASFTISKQSCLTVSGTLTNNAGSAGLLVDAGPSGYSGSLIETTAGVTGSYKASIAKNVWHCISSPITNALVQTVFSDIASNNNNFYYYDETSASNYWTQYTTGAMTVMKGYYTYYFNNKYKTFSGTLNTGNQSMALTYTVAGRAGWNFVGNPYPCAIDWDASGWTKTNIDDAIYVKNGDLWESYVGGVGTCRYIYPGQGFFVKAKTGGGSLAMSNTIKVHRPLDFLKSKTTCPVIQLALTSDTTESFSFLKFSNEATTNFDANHDAHKIFSVNSLYPELFTLSASNDTLSINSFPFSGIDTIIPIGFKTGLSTNYQIRAEQISNFDPSINIFIEDALTGIWTNLRDEGTYGFFSGSCRDINRFFLHFTNSTLSSIHKPKNNNKFTITQPYINGDELWIIINYCSECKIKTELFDVSGKLIYSNNYNIDNNSQLISIKYHSLADGLYFMKVSNSTESLVEKFISITK